MNIRAIMHGRYAVEVVDLDELRVKEEYNFTQRVQRLEPMVEVLRENLEEELSKDDVELMESFDLIVREHEQRLEYLNGLMGYRESEPPEAGEFETLVPYYEVDEETDLIVQKWEVQVGDKNKILAKIETLKEELAGTDFKVAKCFEAQMVGQPLPYDVQELHELRQGQRERINDLRSRLTELEDPHDFTVPA